MSLSGSATCLRNIQQFNFCSFPTTSYFKLIFYAGLIFPLRDVHTIVDVKMITFTLHLKLEFPSLIPLQFF